MTYFFIKKKEKQQREHAIETASDFWNHDLETKYYDFVINDICKI